MLLLLSMLFRYGMHGLWAAVAPLAAAVAHHFEVAVDMARRVLKLPAAAAAPTAQSTANATRAADNTTTHNNKKKKN